MNWKLICAGIVIFFLVYHIFNTSEDKKNMALARKKCELYGKFSGEKLSALSLYETTKSSGNSSDFSRAAEYLLDRGFLFVEYPREPVINRRPGTPMYYDRFFASKLGESDDRYLRLYLAPSSDHNCIPFKHHITRMSTYLDDTLRWKGLGADQCIAVKFTDVLQAEVEHRREVDQDWVNREGYWGRWSQFRERASGKVLAAVWTSGGKAALSCMNTLEVEKLERSISNRNDVTKVSPPVTELRGYNFPLRLEAVPEAVGEEQPDSRQEKRSWSTRKLDYEDWIAPGRLIDNGFTFLRPVYGDSTPQGKDGRPRGSGVGLVGARLYIIREGMRQITNIEDEGRAFPSCDGLNRHGEYLTIRCDAQKESTNSEKWLRQNWLLVYDHFGRPIKKYRFRFNNSALSEYRVNAVHTTAFIGENRISAIVYYTKRENENITGYKQVEVTFKILEND
ncbi:MAG: hypothetical protein VYA55_22005 [Pseudomonadota bacterium]|nr:hypothetical protein [Pseudomonadota bacterium]